MNHITHIGNETKETGTFLIFKDREEDFPSALFFRNNNFEVELFGT